ncbi:unnamed protein product, partial [Ectocarpus sp. 12 AP-2014]
EVVSGWNAKESRVVKKLKRGRVRSLAQQMNRVETLRYRSWSNYWVMACVLTRARVISRSHTGCTTNVPSFSICSITTTSPTRSTRRTSVWFSARRESGSMEGSTS